MKSLETVDNDMLLWVQELLAHNLISLEDIPRSFRQSHSSVYVYAFRRSSYKEMYKRFIADLNVLCDDIMLLETDGNREYTDSLMRTLENALIFNEHIGDERFEYYKSTVDERLLQKLQAFGDGNSKELSEQLRECVFKATK